MITPIAVLSAAEAHALRSHRHAIPVPQAVFELDGPGAADCVQGILTNDVIKPGPRSLVWGGILTPKGMIITDAWVRREEARVWLLVPEAARTTTFDLLRRSVPPRLARITDQSDRLAVRWLIGGMPHAVERMELVRPDGVAPFAALVLAQAAEDVDAQLQEAGWGFAPPALADAQKLLLGWPSLGREIDDRTLPQEVRFDELGGVKYDKGCYTGQETVARLHFRGHANRLLRGIRWAPDAGPVDDTVRQGEKTVGTLRSVGRLGDITIALGMIRREAAVGDTVLAGGGEAMIVDLPFDLDVLSVA